MDWVRLHFGRDFCKEAALCPDYADHEEHSWAFKEHPNDIFWCFGWEN